MLIPTSSADAWREFQDGCGDQAPVRDINDLKHMVYTLGLSYRVEGAVEQPEGATEEAWGNAMRAMYDTGWAWDASVPDEDVIRYYRGE